MMGYPWVSSKMGFSLKGNMPRQSTIDTLYILFIECVMCSLDCDFVMNVGFILGKPYYIVLCLNEHMTTYFGFMDGSSRYTLNLTSTTWVLYSPTSYLLILGGNCLGLAMNNLVEYHAIIGLLI